MEAERGALEWAIERIKEIQRLVRKQIIAIVEDNHLTDYAIALINSSSHLLISGWFLASSQTASTNSRSCRWSQTTLRRSSSLSNALAKSISRMMLLPDGW